MIGNFLAVLNINQLFLKLNQFICNYLPVLSDHSPRPYHAQKSAWCRLGFTSYLVVDRRIFRSYTEGDKHCAALWSNWHKRLIL